MVTCGICKKEVQGSPEGDFFHSFDDWSHYRLFVCSTCLENTPLQRSLHEQCCECGDPPMQTRGDYSAAGVVSPRFNELCIAIEQFEQCHRDLFEKLPFSDDPDAKHLGSTNPNLKKWLEKHGNT